MSSKLKSLGPKKYYQESQKTVHRTGGNICKSHLLSVTCIQNIQNSFIVNIKKWAKIWTEISLKKIDEWPRIVQIDVQHQKLFIGEMQSKPLLDIIQPPGLLQWKNCTIKRVGKAMEKFLPS